MKSNGQHIIVDHVKQFHSQIKELSQSSVYVGIPESNTTRLSSEITNAALGYIHENGAPDANIPARPFLAPGIRNAQDRLSSIFANIAANPIPSRIENGLNAAGLVAVSSVKKKMESGPFVPLAPSTIRARQRRGVMRTQPLIDTAQLQGSITYVIRKDRTTKSREDQIGQYKNTVAEAAASGLLRSIIKNLGASATELGEIIGRFE